MINSSARNCADAIRKVELVWLQRIVQVPLALKALQLWTGCDANSSALRELDLVRPVCLAHNHLTV